MLILKQEDYNKIVDHAKKGLPNEACGLLGGYAEGDKRVVTDVYLLRNVDESREHFSMDPAEQLAAITSTEGNIILGADIDLGTTGFTTKSVTHLCLLYTSDAADD